MSALLRVGVIGATGAVGQELIDLLAERRFPLQELRPVATERSLGEVVEILGSDVAVETEGARLRGLDLVFVCAPPGAALDWVRTALQDEVVCIDLSGSMAGRAEVPLAWAEAEEPPAEAPVLAVPDPAALAIARVAAPLRGRGPLGRIEATLLVAAASCGRGGVDALQAETIALFNQDELPEDTVFGREVAFDAIPETGPVGADGATDLEREVGRQLGRMLGGEPAAVSALRVPVFAGLGVQLSLSAAGTREEVVEMLAKTPGLDVAADGAPSTRDALGDDSVRVGRVRRDPTREGGLLVWLATDPIRLAASHALRLAERRFARG